MNYYRKSHARRFSGHGWQSIDVSNSIRCSPRNFSYYPDQFSSIRKVDYGCGWRNFENSDLVDSVLTFVRNDRQGERVRVAKSLPFQLIVNVTVATNSNERSIIFSIVRTSNAHRNDALNPRLYPHFQKSIQNKPSFSSPLRYPFIVMISCDQDD